MSEQRHFQRIKFAVNIAIEVDGTLHETTLVDISLKGVLVDASAGFTPAPGTHCRSKISLSNSDVVIAFDGEVVHVNDGLVGIKIALIDIESMIHLRRLVTLNAGNPEQVRAELNALFGFGDESEEEDSGGIP